MNPKIEKRKQKKEIGIVQAAGLKPAQQSSERTPPLWPGYSDENRKTKEGHMERSAVEGAADCVLTVAKPEDQTDDAPSSTDARKNNLAGGTHSIVRSRMAATMASPTGWPVSRPAPVTPKG